MTSEQRPADEMSNLVTHGLGLLLSLAATFLLMPIVMVGHELRTTLACGVYCLTLVLAYGALTLSQTFHDLELRRMFRTLDQACIFLLIAGSMTPLAAGLPPSGVVVVIPAGDVGDGCRRSRVRLAPARSDGSGEDHVRCAGLAAGRSGPGTISSRPLGLLPWIVAAGAFYSIGTIFLALDRKLRYFHALWHMFVVVGSICHYVGVLVYIAMREERRRPLLRQSDVPCGLPSAIRLGTVCERPPPSRDPAGAAHCRPRAGSPVSRSRAEVAAWTGVAAWTCATRR